MKKGDLIAVPGKLYPWYENGYAPVTRGEVRKVTANSVDIYFYDTKKVKTYPLDSITETGKKKKEKDEKEYNTISIKKVRT